MLLFENISLDEKTSESGFIILIVPVLLVLFGFFVSAMLTETKPNQFYFETTTQHAMESTQKVLAAYTHRNYRVPCPADPSVVGANFGIENTSGAPCGSTKGILPFKTLGLPESAARDEWGHFLTYKVSPGFAAIVNSNDFVQTGDGDEALLVAGSNSEDFVHQMCQTAAWKETSGSYVKTDGTTSAPGVGNYNKNIYKARFCCPSNVVAGSTTAGVDVEILAKDHKDDIGRQPFMLLGKSGEVKMTFEPTDHHQAIYQAAPEGSNPRSYWQQNLWQVQHRGNFDYNANYGGGHGNGDSLGPRRNKQDADGNWSLQSEHSGVFYRNAAALEFDQESSPTEVKQVGFTASHVGESNWNAHVETRVEIMNSDGTPIPCTDNSIIDNTTHYNHTNTYGAELVIDKADDVCSDGSLKINMVYQLGNEEGVAEADRTGKQPIQISLYDLIGDYTSVPNFYNREMRFGHGMADDSWITYDFPVSTAESYYNAQRDKLKVVLYNAGILSSPTEELATAHIDQLGIRRVKVNATGASLGFSGFSYSTGGTTVAAPPLDDDLEILSESGALRLPKRGAASYSEASSPVTTTVNQDFEAPAYALISHGIDGEGAYLGDGTANQINNIADASENPLEVENATHDRRVHDIRKIISNDQSKKFDDIVMWDSQITLYNSIRGGTCESAQAL